MQSASSGFQAEHRWFLQQFQFSRILNKIYFLSDKYESYGKMYAAAELLMDDVLILKPEEKNIPEMLPDKAIPSIHSLSRSDEERLYHHLRSRTLLKNEYLLNEGDVCRSLFFLSKGAVYQYNHKEGIENIRDLHTDGEWIVNQRSFMTQSASKYAIKAYEKTEVHELSVCSLHELIEQSPIFLSFGKVLEQRNLGKLFYEESFTPRQKYEYILKNRPALLRKFPLKMIASYLKVTPETLSRVRSSIS